MKHPLEKFYHTGAWWYGCYIPNYRDKLCPL